MQSHQTQRNTQAVIAPSTAGRSKGLKLKARKAEGQEVAQGEQGEHAFGAWGEVGGRERKGEKRGERKEGENR